MWLQKFHSGLHAEELLFFFLLSDFILFCFLFFNRFLALFDILPRLPTICSKSCNVLI
jgi:hypothetical protein